MRKSPVLTFFVLMFFLGSAHANGKHYWSATVVGPGWQSTYGNYPPQHIYPPPPFVRTVPMRPFFAPPPPPVVVVTYGATHPRPSNVVEVCSWHYERTYSGRTVRVNEGCWLE